MLTEKELQWIMKKAGDSMVAGGNLDVNLAASGLGVAAERFYCLIQYPNMRPIQEQYNLIMNTAKLMK